MYAQTAANAVNPIDGSALAICRGLPRQAATHVAALGVVQKVAAGQTVFAEGDDAMNVYEVARGTLKLYRLLPDGRRQITGFVSAGRLTGLAQGDLYLYTAEAVTDVTLYRYARARFDRFVDEVPGFARRLLSATSDELCAAQDQMVLLGRKTAPEKIATFLLMMAERQGDDTDDDVHVPMGRTDIADYLGLTTETVSRSLTKLKRGCVISLPTPSHIGILNRDRLEDLAAGEAGEDL